MGDPTAIQLTRNATPTWIEPGDPADSIALRLDPRRPHWRLATALRHEGHTIMSCTTDRGTAVVADPWTVAIQWPAGEEDEVMRVDINCDTAGIQSWAVHPAKA